MAINARMRMAGRLFLRGSLAKSVTCGWWLADCGVLLTPTGYFW